MLTASAAERAFHVDHGHLLEQPSDGLVRLHVVLEVGSLPNLHGRP